MQGLYYGVRTTAFLLAQKVMQAGDLDVYPSPHDLIHCQPALSVYITLKFHQVHTFFIQAVVNCNFQKLEHEVFRCCG